MGTNYKKATEEISTTHKERKQIEDAYERGTYDGIKLWRRRCLKLLSFKFCRLAKISNINKLKCK